MVVVRSLLAVAAMQGFDIFQMNMSNDIQHGDLLEEVYTKMPIGYVGKGEKIQNISSSSSRVCRLKKSMYGLKQAPRQWFSKISSALLSFGFKRCKTLLSGLVVPGALCVVLNNHFINNKEKLA